MDKPRFIRSSTWLDPSSNRQSKSRLNHGSGQSMLVPTHNTSNPSERHVSGSIPLSPQLPPNSSPTPHFRTMAPPQETCHHPSLTTPASDPHHPRTSTHHRRQRRWQMSPDNYPMDGAQVPRHQGWQAPAGPNDHHREQHDTRTWGRHNEHPGQHNEHGEDDMTRRNKCRDGWHDATSTSGGQHRPTTKAQMTQRRCRWQVTTVPAGSQQHRQVMTAPAGEWRPSRLTTALAG